MPAADERRVDIKKDPQAPKSVGRVDNLEAKMSFKIFFFFFFFFFFFRFSTLAALLRAPPQQSVGLGHVGHVHGDTVTHNNATNPRALLLRVRVDLLDRVRQPVLDVLQRELCAGLLLTTAFYPPLPPPCVPLLLVSDITPSFVPLSPRLLGLIS